MVNMLDHLSIPVADVEASAAFYDGIFSVLGYERIKETNLGIGYGHISDRSPKYWILKKRPDNYAQPGFGLHISFAAETQEMVDQFHAMALTVGGEDAGLPGRRPEYTQPFYGAFVLDPDGYKIEAVCRN